MSRRRGLTVPELLVACALLLSLSAMLFSVMVPMMQRSQKLDDRQEELQRLVVLREAVQRQLEPAKVIAFAGAAVDFYLPDRVSTSLGEVIRVDSGDVPAWNETRRWQLRQEGTLVVSGLRNRARERVLFDLGTGGNWQLDFSALPLLTVQLHVVRNQRAEDCRFDFVLDNFRQP